jgi:hypothetical protein
VLTVTDEDVVYSAPPFAALSPGQLPPLSPRGSLVALFGVWRVERNLHAVTDNV